MSPALVAGTYPERAIDVIVPFPAGSGTDTGARLLTHELAQQMNATFVVNNRPGAGGSIAAMEVVRAKPDGYTLFFSSNSPAASNVALFKTLPYDPATDLTPIAGIAASALVLMVRDDHPAQSLEEFLRWAAEQPNPVTGAYGSASTQISLGVLGKLAEIDVMPVPYRGVPQAINDTLAGVVDFTFVDIGNALTQANGGNMRGLGLTSAAAAELAPDWPPLSEYLPGFNVGAWLALFGPADMPADVVEDLSRNVAVVLELDAMRDKLAAIGLQPMYMAPSQLGEHVVTEIAHWQQMAKDANVEPQ